MARLALKVTVVLSLFAFALFNPGNASSHFGLHSTGFNKTTYVYICISKNAYAYHSHQCRGLAKCTHSISKVTVSEASKMGYRACKICY